jgi:hypothetical protein
MTVIVDPPSLGKYDSPARPPGTARRRFATAAVVAAALIIGVLGWRWVLVEATTDYGPAPESLAIEPEVRPHAKHSPPPIELEVTALDVHTAKEPFPGAASAKAVAPAARVPARPVSTAKTRR